MARIFLVNPPASEPVRSPLLALAFLAASLRRDGHAVALWDASAPRAPCGGLLPAIEAFGPDAVGLHLKTLDIQSAYACAAALGGRWPLVAGGPHATACPAEALANGFEFVLTGEADLSICAFARALDGRAPFEAVAGLHWRDGSAHRSNGCAATIADLDALPSALDAIDLYDPAWYGDGPVCAPAALLASRGCPAACTFCANLVTGRRIRQRSVLAVAAEAARLCHAFGQRAFSFADDSFAVGRHRTLALCAALEAVGPLHWTCTAHPRHLHREVVDAMARAGCGGVDLGLESGDPAMLRRIGKGVTVERAFDVLGWCRDAGIRATLNLMFGWPDETPASVQATLDLIERAAPLVAGFNARGVVIPLPGTLLFARTCAPYDLDGWWLRDPPLPAVTFPVAWDADAVLRAWADDPALARNFFRHPSELCRQIQLGLDRKAWHTLRNLEQARAGG